MVNEKSLTARKKVQEHKDGHFILEYIQNNGSGYSKQLARIMGKGLNQISGRFTELRESGFIVSTGEVKEGCSVYKPAGEQIHFIF